MKNRKEISEEQMDQVNGGLSIMPNIVANNLLSKKGQENDPSLLANATGKLKATNMTSGIVKVATGKEKEVTSIPVGHPDFRNDLA